MSARYGIDTSVLVRLATGDPERDYLATLGALSRLVESDGAEIAASNQVIGEAYVALQHHYLLSKAVARTALKSVLESGLVSPSNGPSVLDDLSTMTRCGLLDRLIVNDYNRQGLKTVTNDKRMARLSGSVKL